MSKRKQIQRGLLNNSAAAYYAAIELHNKPNVSYRYETTTLLMLNAWELLLKAYVRKYTTCDIFLKDGRTITFGKALEETLRSMEGKEFKAFKPVSENLYLLEKYRNEFAHFYRDDMDAAVFSLLAKSSLNYIEFRKRYFPSYRFVDEGLYILPLGFSLPFQPELLFSGGKQTGSFSPETKKFLELIARVTTGLQGDGIEDSVVVGFDIHLSSVKSVANADIIAKIEEGGAPVSVQKRVRITDEPGAQAVTLTDDEFFETYPLTYQDVVDLCRERIDDFTVNARFHAIMKERVKNNQRYAGSRSLNPDKSNARIYYRAEAADVVKAYWQDAGGERSAQ